MPSFHFLHFSEGCLVDEQTRHRVQWKAQHELLKTKQICQKKKNMWWICLVPYFNDRWRCSLSDYILRIPRTRFDDNWCSKFKAIRHLIAMMRLVRVKRWSVPLSWANDQVLWKWKRTLSFKHTKMKSGIWDVVSQ